MGVRRRVSSIRFAKARSPNLQTNPPLHRLQMGSRERWFVSYRAPPLPSRSLMSFSGPATIQPACLCNLRGRESRRARLLARLDRKPVASPPRAALVAAFLKTPPKPGVCLRAAGGLLSGLRLRGRRFGRGPFYRADKTRRRLVLRISKRPTRTLLPDGGRTSATAVAASRAP